jgi:hypothetical protein
MKMKLASTLLYTMAMNISILETSVGSGILLKKPSKTCGEI